MKSIEERYMICHNCKEKIDSNKCDGNCKLYWEYQGATEQKAIDDAELTEVKRQRDEYYDELLKLRRQKVEFIEKACEWMRLHLPRVIENYPINGKRVAMLNEDMREDFRKDMEE